ncbi:MAG: urease accessory protein UreF [Burkholderiales bacterium]|nr:urease accessory protein UreF [Burkholderiales bacterium]
MPSLVSMMRLVQFSDGTFPVGTFTFSNGLETASHEKLVTNAETLRQFTEAALAQAIQSDAVAALHAYRSAAKGDYGEIVKADWALINFKMNDEARLMLQRMGKKLAELAVKLMQSDLITRWAADISSGATPGTYPVAQGICAYEAGMSEKELFCCHQYGVMNMVVSAALRCVRVSHFDTQKIIFDLGSHIEEEFDLVSSLKLEDMNAFVPEMDVLASLHEKGNMRMFMN